MIYKPKGRAREYSPLALNIYSGCDHGCRYCYVPGLLRRDRESFRRVVVRADVLQEVGREAGRLNGEDQVLLCFTGDPYCRRERQGRGHADIFEPGR